MNDEETQSNFFSSFGQAFDGSAVAKAAIGILLVVLAAVAVTLLMRVLLNRLQNHLIARSRKEGEPPSEADKRIDTLMRLLRRALDVSIWLLAVLVALREAGVQIGPLLASAGILGLAVGFGAQNLVRDVISGFFLIMENQIRVGDVAIINGTGGLVEQINFRTTVLRDLGGVVHIFPNGAITTVSNMTREWSAYIFEIGVAYKEDIDRVIDVMRRVGRELKEDPALGPLMFEEPEIFGLDKFASSALVVKGRIRTRPIRQWQVGREFLRRIKIAFDAEGIEIPFPHQTLYFGEASKPFDVRMTEARRPGGGEEASGHGS
jgi:moderate conductance mechanosensitive channel